jgi:muramoyltetrapeptide carboxypeptidase LdcA involved in peptidoglycan recycling
VSYDNMEAPAGTPATIKVGETTVKVKYTPEEIAAAKAAAEAKLAALSAAQPQDAKAVEAAKKVGGRSGCEKTANGALLGTNLTAALKAAGYPPRPTWPSLTR